MTTPRGKSTKPPTYADAENDARRLKVLWDERKASDPDWPSQELFGETYGIGGQGMVWQYLNFHTPLNLGAANKFAAGLRCKVSDFSPHWAEQAKKAADAAAQRFVQVRRIDVALSAGRGQIIFDESEASPLSFQETYLRGQGVAAKNAVIVNVTGRSMEPTIPEGAVLLVNHAAREVANGRIYALRIGNEVLVKRLHKKAGKVLAVSDNPDRDEYPDRELDETVDFAVIGRAIWMGASL